MLALWISVIGLCLVATVWNLARTIQLIISGDVSVTEADRQRFWIYAVTWAMKVVGGAILFAIFLVNWLLQPQWESGALASVGLAMFAFAVRGVVQEAFEGKWKELRPSERWAQNVIRRRMNSQNAGNDDSRSSVPDQRESETDSPG